MTAMNYKPTEQRKAELGGADFYPTPKWCTEALCAVEKFEYSIDEPACGTGEMAEVLRRENPDIMIRPTDLNDYGRFPHGYDFLARTALCDNIVTNPPYNLAEAFVHKALELAQCKVCLLLRLAFLEGSGRAGRIFADNPPARIWVFSERITFYPNGIQTAGSGTTAYAWFVWDKQATGPKPVVGWLKGYKTK
jgi:hypothetical protein